MGKQKGREDRIMNNKRRTGRSREQRGGEDRAAIDPHGDGTGRNHLCLAAREPWSLANLRRKESTPNWRHSGDIKAADLSLEGWKLV